jgi:hypothetical protein
LTALRWPFKIFCSQGSVAFFTTDIVIGFVILAYLSYQSIKTFKSSHVRSAAFTRGLLITLCVVFYAIFLMSSCSNKELRPRFLQGFSILIFGLMLCGCLLTIPCAIGFVLSRVGKHRQKDLLLHLDCIFYVWCQLRFPNICCVINTMG